MNPSLKGGLLLVALVVSCAFSGALTVSAVNCVMGREVIALSWRSCLAVSWLSVVVRWAVAGKAANTVD